MKLHLRVKKMADVPALRRSVTAPKDNPFMSIAPAKNAVENLYIIQLKNGIF